VAGPTRVVLRWVSAHLEVVQGTKKRSSKALQVTDPSRHDIADELSARPRRVLWPEKESQAEIQYSMDHLNSRIDIPR
jgi:hypothetical protein